MRQVPPPDVQLPPPARYFPPANGRYEVTTGLIRLGSDLGNGEADARLFQLDRDWPRYRRAKEAARRESLGKYVLTQAVSAEAARALTQWMTERLTWECPEGFATEAADGGFTLQCRPSGERLAWDAEGHLQTVEGATPAYVDGLDALALQVQEDLAVIEGGDDGYRLTGLHLCFPNHWAAKDKIGGDFAAVHAPVPGMERINRQSVALQRALVSREPVVRFAWGLATDTRLNHHPEPPPGWSPGQWQGRAFDPEVPMLYLRIERQGLAGLPGVDAYVFTIRTYFSDVGELAADQREALAEAIESMDAATLAYKGIAGSRDAILRWLRGLNTA